MKQRILTITIQFKYRIFFQRETFRHNFMYKIQKKKRIASEICQIFFLNSNDSNIQLFNFVTKNNPKNVTFIININKIRVFRKGTRS